MNSRVRERERGIQESKGVRVRRIEAQWRPCVAAKGAVLQFQKHPAKLWANITHLLRVYIKYTCHHRRAGAPIVEGGVTIIIIRVHSRYYWGADNITQGRAQEQERKARGWNAANNVEFVDDGDDCAFAKIVDCSIGPWTFEGLSGEKGEKFLAALCVDSGLRL